MTRGWFRVQGVVKLREVEEAERVLKKGCCCGCDALAVEGERRGVVTCLLEPGGVGAGVLRAALRLATDGFPSEMSSV